MSRKRNIIACGCLILSSDTGRILLQQRSGTTTHPRSWGFFGGRSEGEERPVETITRELQEEIGLIPDIKKFYPLYKYTSPDKKFVYHTFVVLVLEEFTPHLNNESDGYCWVSMNNWPRPLHPGVKAQLYNNDFLKKLRTICDSLVTDSS